MTSVNGVAIKLSDTSLDVSTLGLQVSSTYKTETLKITEEKTLTKLKLKKKTDQNVNKKENVNKKDEKKK